VNSDVRNAWGEDILGRWWLDGMALARGKPRAGIGDVHFTVDGYKSLAADSVLAVQRELLRKPGVTTAAAIALLVGVAVLTYFWVRN